MRESSGGKRERRLSEFEEYGVKTDTKNRGGGNGAGIAYRDAETGVKKRINRKRIRSIIT